MAKMTDETRKQCEDALAAIADMRKQGIMPEHSYFKSLVCLAYEFAIADEQLRAATLVQTIPLSYFTSGIQAQQMADDENYLYVAYTMAKALVDCGIVDLMPVKTNVPLGQA